MIIGSENVMTVNGKDTELNSPVNLGQFLESCGYDINRVAVEKNGNIVSKNKYGTELLSDSDRIEIVCFVGGG